MADKNKQHGGDHPVDLEESRDNHPHSIERTREMNNRPHEGEGTKNSGDSDNENIQKPEGASPNPEDANDRGGREGGYRTNYGGFGGEAGGQADDRRSLDDWTPGEDRDERDE